MTSPEHKSAAAMAVLVFVAVMFGFGGFMFAIYGIDHLTQNGWNLFGAGYLIGGMAFCASVITYVVQRLSKKNVGYR